MMSKGHWYVATTIRLTIGIGLVAVLYWLLQLTGLPWWSKAMIEVVLIIGVVGGIVTTTPLSYERYKRLREQLTETSTRGPVD